MTDENTTRTARRLLSDSALLAFALNGRFLALAEELARPAGLTAAWWQVLGAVIDEPRPVAGIARAMGITRQSVQRIADLLAERRLVSYRDNPEHRRAKLVELTDSGREAMAAIGPGHARAAAALAESLGPDRWAEIVDALRTLTTAIDDLDRPATR